MMWQLLMGSTAASRVMASIPAASSEPHRYWRVNCYANQAGFGTAISIAKLELRETISGPNVATGGTAIAGSYETGYEPAKAFDGNSATFWSKNGYGPYWVGYDFGAGNAVDIAEISITARNDASFGQAPGCGYVEHSDDGVTWTKAWPFGAFSQATTGSAKVHTKPTLTPSTHRYWRMGLCGSHLAGTSDYPISLSELEMRATVGGADQTFGKTATASTSFNGSSLPPLAIDDNLTTIWSSLGTAAQPDRYTWLKVDFGSAVPVKEISLVTRTNVSWVKQFPVGVSLWFSDDNVNWSLADCWSQAAAPTSENQVFNYAVSYQPSSVPVNTFDSLFSGMAGVYSLKKRVAAYTGPAVRVYDTGNASEQDVGFDGFGRLASFTVTGIARVTKWYDQSGNGMDVSQTTVARMPRLHIQGSPSFQPTIEFRSFEDNYLESVPVLGGPLALPRPIIGLAVAYESNTLFEVLTHVSNAATHTTPYSRWSLGRNGSQKIDSRWNGNVMTGTGAGPAVPAGWQPLVLDGASSASNLRYHFGDAATFTDYASSTTVTYGSASKLQIGANAVGGEGSSQSVCELVIAGNAPVGTIASIFAELDTWNNFADSGYDSVASSRFDNIPNVTPVIGGGMVKRNPAYSGPAIRVYDTATTAQTDVNFDSNGFVTGALPYGANTRLHTIYDQWGSDNLVVVGTPDATLVVEGGAYKCWRVQFNGSSYLKTASTTSTPGAWVKDTCLWAIGLIRTASRTALQTVWGVESTVNYMDVGLWMGTNGFAHFRVDGGNATDVLATNYTTDAARVANVLAPMIGVVGGQGNCIVSCNDDRATFTRSGLSHPITWDAGKSLCLGGGLGVGAGCLEQITEFHYFARDDDNAGLTLNRGAARTINSRMKQVLV